MKKYYIKKNWRAVGDAEYDVFHRDTLREVKKLGTVGTPEEVYAVIAHTGRKCTEADPHKVIADCYTRADAVIVRDALNGKAHVKMYDALAHATAILENVLAHHGRSMPKADQISREKAIAEFKALLAKAGA
jgi:hypothetical protein